MFREFPYLLFHCLEVSGKRPHNDLMHAGILETLDPFTPLCRATCSATAEKAATS